MPVCLALTVTYYLRMRVGRGTGDSLLLCMYSDTENIRPFTVESFLCTSQPHLYQLHLKEQLRTIRVVRMPNGQYRVSDAYCFIYTRVYIVADNPVR